MDLQRHLDRLKPYVDENETTVDGYATEYEAGVLTDRQLLSLEISGEDENRTVVDSVYLDQVSGAKIEHQQSPEFDHERLGYGIVSLFVALVSIALIGVVDDGSISGLLVLIGVGVGVLGIVLLIEAYNTPDGSVRIELQSAGGEVIWQRRLAEDQLEFAKALSRTVSNAHDPAGRVTRHVGK